MLSTTLSRFRNKQLRTNPKKDSRSFIKTFSRLGRWDLGFSALRLELKEIIGPRFWLEDIVAGLVVACAAVPLSLAISLASGVSPATGLITAIVAGIVCAIFGGTPLAVSGPAAAMAVLISTVVATHGLVGLVFVTLITGVLQVLTGVFQLGRIIRFIPLPVVMGFTAGIGAIILMGQIPRALDLVAPDPAHICTFWSHIGELWQQANLKALFLSLLSMSIMLTVPARWPKIPAALVAVIVPSTLALFLGQTVATIGQIPSSLPLPRIPELPQSSFWEIVITSLTVYAIASLETLLSSSAVDKMSKSRPHDSDQELIGQGLGNMVSAFFGGIPATGVIARSSLNIQAGGKTRRSAIIHSLFLIATVYVLSPLISRIPISVLAGILLSVALKMLSPKDLLDLWKSSKGDAVVYIVTFITIVVVGLLAGVQAGIIAALVIATVRLSQVQISFHSHEGEGPFRISLVGPLTFLSSSKIAKLKSQVMAKKQERVLIDLSRVTFMDSSGAEQLVSIVESLQSVGSRIIVLNPTDTCRRMLGDLPDLFATSEAEARSKLGDNSFCRILHGIKLYKETKRDYQPLFEKLAIGQNPHTLLITCSDSRIDPSLLTSTQPGELFVVRNVGNLIPKYGSEGAAGEQAALEYSLNVLDVRDVIVCGHSGCGAVQAVLNGVPSALPGVNKWLSSTMGKKLPTANVDEASQANVLQQIEHLMSYPLVRDRLERGVLRIHGWFFQIKSGEVLVWSEEHASFRSAVELSSCGT